MKHLTNLSTQLAVAAAALCVKARAKPLMKMDENAASIATEGLDAGEESLRRHKPLENLHRT